MDALVFEIEPRKDRGFRAWGTDGRARLGRAVFEGLLFLKNLSAAA